VTKPNKTAIPLKKQWKLTSYRTARANGEWYIKASFSSLNTLCVVMYNEKTDECQVGFFTDELEANRFIEYTLEKA
jgi:hypothetical protein